MGRLSYLHNLYIDSYALLHYRGVENINAVLSFLRNLLREHHSSPAQFDNNYESIIGFLSGGAGGSHWDFTFEQDNNVDDSEIIMRMRYVDRNGNRVSSLDKPSRVILVEQKEIVEQLRRFIADKDIHADNQFGYFYTSTGIRITIQNTQTGETIDGGFQLNRTVDISNDEAVQRWINEMSNFMENREAGFIKDGYEWRIVDFEGFDFVFSPRTNHRQRIWNRRNNDDFEAQRMKRNIIEKEAVEYKRKKWKLNDNIKIGRRIKLPKWWFKKVGHDIVSDKNDCIYKAILRSVIKKHHPAQYDYEEAHNKFIWEDENYRFPIEGPATRKDMIQWNRMNPNYYLCVYGYEGLDEKTDSILFVNELRPFLLPPEDRKNKQLIYLIVTTPKEICDKLDDLRDEYNRRDALDNFSIYAHCFPITSLPRMLTSNHHKAHVCEKCLHIYSTPQALKRHHSFGCFEFHKSPENIPKTPVKFKGADYRKLGEVPAHITDG